MAQSILVTPISSKRAVMHSKLQQMDENRLTTRGKPSILCREKAFFDGMHSRCKGYKTLTLWMHHPEMRKMQRLATMDCKKETADMIALFFETSNEALAEVVGEKGISSTQV